MKEVRDIKIDMLMGNHNPIVDLFNEITKDLQIINCKVYNNDGLEFIYFVPTKSAEHYFNKEKEWIFYFAYAKSAKHYQDAKNGDFWCVYNRYWELFESKFHLKYLEIQAITKYLVVQRTLCISKVEEALKREVDTPSYHYHFECRGVEEALKREVGEPNTANRRMVFEVEDALKKTLDKK